MRITTGSRLSPTPSLSRRGVVTTAIEEVTANEERKRENIRFIVIYNSFYSCFVYTPLPAREGSGVSLYCGLL
jgi:hypothetical protein